MAKTVVSSQMVAHLWAAQTQDEAHTASNSMSFKGTRIYSYAMCIGDISSVATLNGLDIKVILLNAYARSRSNTTSNHFGMEASAVSHLCHVYTVPNVSPHALPLHHENMAHLVSVYNAIKGRYLRAKKADAWNGYGRKELEKAFGAAKGYAFIFVLDNPELDLETDCAAIDLNFVRLAALASDPKKVAARQKAEARRQKRKDEEAALAALGQVEKLEAWKAGKKVYLPQGGFKTPSGGVYLRVVKDILETSMGVIVPLAEAIAVFEVADKLVNSMRILAVVEIDRRCGAFVVNSIYPNGNIKAGCHLIEFAESVRIAQQLGLPMRGIPAMERAAPM